MQPVVSLLETVICGLMVLACVTFLLFGHSKSEKTTLIKKLYISFCSVFLTWPLALIFMHFTSPANTRLLWILDSCTYLGVGFCPVLMLLIVLVFVTNAEKLPKWCNLLLIVPTLTNIVVWTNDFHHLQYVNFSVIRSEIVFGPYLFFSGAYTYLALIAAIVLLLRFGFKNDFRLFWAQIVMLTLGAFVPLAVSCYATFSGRDVSITATPISFISTLVCNFLAIFQLHLFEIVPMATQQILDWIPDGYLVIDKKYNVIDYNKHFHRIFGKQFNIGIKPSMKEHLTNSDGQNSTLFHLLSALESSAASLSPVAYEQAVSVEETEDEPAQRYYYMVDITPLEISDQLIGFVIIFKDITQVRKTMQQVQEGQQRMMEQERLALLGQMVGGLAHNLKTPIMGIAGCSTSIESLLVEEDTSLGDPEVTDDDYREIHDEIRGWITKIRESCSYMSDIITAVKGQAANANNNESRDFTLDELLKRTALLMRHELQGGGCTLLQDTVSDLHLIIRGDINSLVQVLNNLVGNAVDAVRECERREIRVGATLNSEELQIYVQDSGPGIEPRVMERLFQEMTTTKGAKGTGLGLYISNTIIRGKFGGKMFAKDNENGGATIGFTIPIENAGVTQVEKIREVML